MMAPARRPARGLSEDLFNPKTACSTAVLRRAPERGAQPGCVTTSRSRLSRSVSLSRTAGRPMDPHDGQPRRRIRPAGAQIDFCRRPRRLHVRFLSPPHGRDRRPARGRPHRQRVRELPFMVGMLLPGRRQRGRSPPGAASPAWLTMKRPPPDRPACDRRYKLSRFRVYRH